MIQVLPRGMGIFNLSKTVSQKKTYVIVRLVGVVQSKRGMESGKSSGTETMGEMMLLSTGNKDEEGKAILVKET